VIVTGPLESYNCLLEIAPSQQRAGYRDCPGARPKPYATGAIGEASEGGWW